MEIANQIFFIFLALITAAITLSAIPQFQVRREDWPNIYWPLSTSFYALSALSFGLALWVNKFLLTVANTSFLMSSIALIFLYRSWNGKPFNRIQTQLLWMIPLGIAILYEPLRTTPNTFLYRVALITVTQEFLIAWQLWELIKFYKKERQAITGWIIFLTVLTLIGNVLRTYQILSGGGPTNIYIYTEDAFALTLRWITYATNIMTFVALSMFYLKKQITKENNIKNALERSKEENELISKLLKEKEYLLQGLMKANRTATTGALSASIAHELNQPLGASNINIQFLKSKLEKGQLNPELGKEVLDDLERDNKRAATIVRSLRSIFTESRVKTEDVKVSQLISNILEIVNPELRAKNIQITMNLDQNLRVQIKDVELQQVFLNLINNAVQSISSVEAVKGLIQIEATQNEEKTQICVSDNGSGVPKERQSGLFELLNTTKETGMGLGLWLCKHIITRYGGSIHYEDVPDGGARFVIQLPQVN